MRSAFPFHPFLMAALLTAGCLPESKVPAPLPPPRAQAQAGAGPVASGVQIRPGPATPTVLAAATAPGGQPVAVACSTCHATRPPNRTTTTAAALREFHGGLHYRHGQLTCLSCHNSANYDTLRLADGAALAYPQTIQLCAQCHGPQFRDYTHGTHGGMNGYWDLQRGSRTRNTCVDCHDPHAPAYPQVRPVFPPRDRGVRPTTTTAGPAVVH